MKISLYIEDGLEQIVLTPETETERGIVNKIHDETRELSIRRGEFYRCQGGWVRWSQSYSSYGSDHKPDESTMIVLRKKTDDQMTARSGTSNKDPS